MSGITQFGLSTLPLPISNKAMFWAPHHLGWLRFDFDASVIHDISFLAIIYRNHKGQPLNPSMHGSMPVRKLV